MRIAQNLYDRHLVFRDDFTSVKSVVDNGGVATGSPTIDHGVKLNGTSQYVDYALGGKTIGNDPITIKIDFIPDGAIDNSLNQLFLDSDSTQYQVLKNSANFWKITLGGTLVISANAATAASIWKVGERNTLIITGTSGDTDLYLNNNLLVEAASAAWTSSFINTLRLGRATGSAIYFDGCFCEISIFHTKIEAEEVKDLWENDTYQEIERPVISLFLKTQVLVNPSGINAITDGDMELPDTSAWTLVGGTSLAKITDTVDGQSTQVMQMTGGSGTRARQTTTLTNGATYRVTGWAKDDGTTACFVGLGTNLLNVNSGTGYGFFDVTGTANNTYFDLYHSGSGDSYFDDIVVEQLELSTENKGTLGGYAKVGDGVTSTTYPTQLYPNGNQTDGGDYLDLGVSPITNTNQPFTVAGIFTGAVDTNGSYMSSTNRSDAGFALSLLTGNRLYLDIYSSSGNYRGRYAPGPFTAGMFTVVGTYDGSLSSDGVKIYINGVREDTTNSSAGTLVAAAISNNIRMGMNPDGTGSLASGATWRSPKLYNYEATPLQARKIHHDLMNKLNL